MYVIPKELIIIDKKNNIEYSNCPVNLNQFLYFDRGELTPQITQPKDQSASYIVHESSKLDSPPLPTIEFFLPSINPISKSFDKIFWVYRNASDRDTEYNNIIDAINTKNSTSMLPKK